MERMIDLNLQPQNPNDDNSEDFQERSHAFNFLRLDSFNSSATTNHPSANTGYNDSEALQLQPSSPKVDVDKSSGYKERLRMMRHYMREMSRCWDEVLHDELICEEEEDRGTEDNSNSANVTKANSESDSEETVSVERAAGSFIINFRCPCGKGYQILLSGTTCYYKLM